jgi:hypothetical protein
MRPYTKDYSIEILQEYYDEFKNLLTPNLEFLLTNPALCVKTWANPNEHAA